MSYKKKITNKNHFDINVLFFILYGSIWKKVKKEKDSNCEKRKSRVDRPMRIHDVFRTYRRSAIENTICREQQVEEQKVKYGREKAPLVNDDISRRR